MTEIYKHSSEIIATDLGDELILLDPRNGEMFGLDACGRRIWLDLPIRPVTEIAKALCSEFDVEPDRARSDVESLITALAGAGLIEHDDTTTS